MGDPIAHFMAVTECRSEEKAIEFLSLADFNVDTAVQLYMADRGLSSQDDLTQPPPPPPDTQKRMQLREEYDPSLAMAQGMYGSHGRGYGAYQQPKPDEDGFFRANKQSPPRPGKSGRPSAPTELDKAFRAPDYAFKGTLRDAAAEAIKQSKYLLLNVLESGDLVSGSFNRDVWKNDLIAAQVQAYFVLWQAASGTENGQSTIDGYKIDKASMPYIAVLNPLTKSVIKDFPRPKLIKGSDASGFSVSTERVSELLIDFMDRHGPFVAPKLEAVPTPSEVVHVDAKGSTALAVAQTSEEDDLAQALAMSEQVEEAEAQPAKMQDVDLTPYSAGDDLVNLRVKLPSGAWDLQLTPTTPMSILASAIGFRLEAAMGDIVEIRTGFPPKKLEWSEDACIKDTTIRKGDVLVPSIKS